MPDEDPQKTHLPLRDTASLKALFNTESDVLGNSGFESLNIFTVDGSVTAENGLNEIGLKVEEGLGDLHDTRVLRVESSDEVTRGAEGVEFGVHGTHGEDGHLVLSEVGDEVGRAVLKLELGFQSALDDHVDLCTTGVGVGGIEATWAEETESHGDTGAGEGGECSTVCFDCAATVTDCV